jgi:hypothetical protein
MADDRKRPSFSEALVIQRRILILVLHTVFPTSQQNHQRSFLLSRLCRWNHLRPYGARFVVTLVLISKHGRSGDR